MNTTENLVEAYYRNKGHFTMSDIKVENGNNRQFDILTYHNKSDKYYHIEVNVTHSLRFLRPLNSIKEEVRAKFFGITKNKRPSNSQTDFAKGKSYLKAIKNTYEKYNINYNNVIRVWCTWCLSTEDFKEINIWKNELAKEFGLTHEQFEILNFRDEVIPTLLETIGTSNYDNQLLRILSLLNQFQKQTQLII